jgi:CSLREA domain-containing protein
MLGLGAVLLGSCSDWGGALTAISTACAAPEFLVTKTDDTNDGVCSYDDCSLREAIVFANMCPGADTIRVPDGTYVLDRHGAGEDAADTGDLDITDDLTILGDVLPTIDGDAADRVFDIHSPAVVILDSLIITNGQYGSGAGIENYGELTISNTSITGNHAILPPNSPGGGSAGGGIFQYGASTTIVDSQISGNTAETGGAIANFLSDLVITNSVIANNMASTVGGGLWNQIVATATFNNVAVEGNTADGEGGGIYNNGTIEFNGGNISMNTAPRGGGLYNSGMTVPGPNDPLGPGDVTLNQVSFFNNISGQAGAGIWNEGRFELNQGEIYANGLPQQGGGMFNAPDGEAYLYDAWFLNNNAYLGGAVFNQGLIHVYRVSFTVNLALSGKGAAIYNHNAMPGVLLRNVTVSGNTAYSPTPGGAGVYNFGGDLDVSFSTFAYNSPDGILNDGGGNVTITSSILAYHAVNCSGVGSPSTGYNIDSQNVCGFIEPSDMVNTDPLLTSLAMNGGVNLSHAPLPTSPAVDTGHPSMCIAADQRGVSRPQGVDCDRGSIELTDEPPATEESASEDSLSMDFYDDGNYLLLGECTTLHWEVQNAENVMLNGVSVDPQDLEYVCPESTMTYILMAWNDDEQAVEAITIEVEILQPPAAPTQFSIKRRECTSLLYSLTLEWNDMADNETGFRIYRDGQLVTTLGADVELYSENPPRGAVHTYGIEAFNSDGASSRPTLQEAACLIR